MAYIAWSHKAAASNTAGRSLSCIFCALCMNSTLGLLSHFVPGVDNPIADHISQVHSSGSAPNFDFLLQEFLQLSSCCCYHQSKDFVSILRHLAHQSQRSQDIGNHTTVLLEIICTTMKLHSDPFLIHITPHERHLIMGTYATFLSAGNNWSLARAVNGWDSLIVGFFDDLYLYEYLCSKSRSKCSVILKSTKNNVI